MLKKVPFDFHYRYVCGTREYRHKIADWEAGALYLNCRSRYGDDWEAASGTRSKRNYRRPISCS